MKPIVALDIGSSALAAVEVKAERDGALTLVRAAVEPLPPGLVHDGEIENPDALAREVKRFWRGGRFSGHRVRLGVANQRVVVRNLDVPAFEDPVLRRAAVANEAAERMPSAGEGAVLDFQPVMRFRDGDEERERCVVVAAEREMVRTLAGVAKRAGLNAVSIDLEAFALLRAVLDEPPVIDDGSADSRAQVVCHIGAEVTNIIVAVDRRCHLTRLVSFGGVRLTEAVAERTELPLEEAEAMKRACGLLGDAPEEWDAELVAEVRHALALGARPLAREIARSLEYYRSQELARPVERIVLTGGTALCGGLDRFLAQALALPVELGDPRRHLDGADLLGPETAARAAVAVGLVLDAGGES